MFVKLQRPPPDIRIFLPALLAWSMSSTWRPRWAAVRAHISPAAPAPMITTSVERNRSSGLLPAAHDTNASSAVPVAPARGRRPRVARLRRRGREGEGQRLGVGAGAQRVVGADVLAERDGDRVVGDRARPRLEQRRRSGAAD